VILILYDITNATSIIQYQSNNIVKKEEALLNPLSEFGKRAVASFYRRRFTGLLISGEFAKGKTTTAMHMGREILMALYGWDELVAWPEVLRNTLFSMNDVMEATQILHQIDWLSLTPKQVLYHKFWIRRPFLLWDDAGVHGSKYKHFLDMGDAMDLQTNFDTIRDITSCFIMTVPEDEELLKFLRSYRGIMFAEIHDHGQYLRSLTVYKWKRNRAYQKRRKVAWHGKPYRCFVPNDTYGEYDRLRTLAKIENSQRYAKKKKMKEAKQKYYETRQKYYQMKMEKEMQEMQMVD
jgi:hypothetical protein